jgi:hypothetical protein
VDPSKGSSKSSFQEENKKDNKKEEIPPLQKHVKFLFSSMEDCAPPYGGLYPSLAPF